MLTHPAIADKSATAVHIDFLNGETPVVSSLDVAKNFNKDHRHLLRDIDKICTQLPEIFVKTNFGHSVREVDTFLGKRKQRYYLLTRDAFSFLVMGFTGAAAICWKLRYIEAFNALEKAAREHVRAMALESATRELSLARESAYRQGYDAGRASALPDVLGAENKARS